MAIKLRDDKPAASTSKGSDTSTFALTVKTDRATGASNLIDLRPSFMTRMKAAVQYVRDGKTPDWFGPGAPLPPQAPEQVKGREFDFPTSYNLNYSPKFQEGPTYNTLRQLSYSLDLLRLVIETRKDEVCKLKWAVQPRDEKAKRDDRCKAIEEFMAMPDKEHTWEEWLRLLLEDLLVIDAPCIYPRKAMDGSLYSLEPVDGSTIKRVIDDWGRTPIAPYPAYQQILKGLPATDYTRDELIYRPRNLRTNRVYGYSPVEQLLVTINIALNRQASMLTYYTEGSTPDLILSVPEGWTPEQVAKFKVWWDGILAGNVPNKRGTMFVFNGTQAVDTKEKLLVDGADEWLARVICYCFGQSPQPFVKEMNRATADVNNQTSKEQGVQATMAWVTNIMNLIIIQKFGAPDLCFTFKVDQDVDAKTQAEIFDKKLRAGARTINEWREADGMEPAQGGDTPLVYTASGATPLDKVLNPPDPIVAAPGAVPGKTAPAGNAPKPPLAKALRPVTKDENKFAKQVAKTLRKVRNDVLSSMVQLDYIQKAKKKSLAEPDTVLRNIDLTGFDDIRVTIEAALAEVGTDGFVKALEEAGVDTGADVFALANPRAVSYAAERAAELIKELEEGTRTLIRGTIVEALEENWSYPQLADELAKSYAFSPERAATIAATEMNDALTVSALDAWTESGVVVAKRWLLSNDEGVCPICTANADQGDVPLAKEFESGDNGPPAHPNCRCTVTPIVGDD